MKLRVVVAAIAFIFSLSVCAQSFETGGDLLNLCKKHLKREGNAKDALDSGFCLGYIDGFLTGYNMRTVFPSANTVCEKVGQMTRDQLVREVVAILEKSEWLSAPKATAMFGVFMESGLSCSRQK